VVKESPILIVMTISASLAIAITTSIMTVQPTAAQPPGSDNADERPGWDPNGVNPGFDEGLKKGWMPMEEPPGYDEGLKAGWKPIPK
jgi:hypothetical protein